MVRMLPVCLLALGVACSPADKPADTTTAAAAVPAPATTAPDTTAAAASSSTTPTDTTAKAGDPNGMRLEVDLNARKLYVYKGTERVATHPVAVGSKEWPTQTGEWNVKQVVFNPEWIPPDESWAEEREPRKPGDPKNPLGRAQLVYDPPRTIHGTDVPSSIGKPVSHGSIRLANDVIVPLARQVMEAGGVTKDDAWFKAAAANRTEKQIVDLPHPIPIKVF
jgi:lipoprotein-anchoring transpeptidase ErfK/SrfK